MDMSKDLVAASATPLVLAILADGDSYGYAIIRGGRVVRRAPAWTDGMLYPVLHRLERQGSVAAKWSSPTPAAGESTTESRKKDGRSSSPAAAVEGRGRHSEGVLDEAEQYDDIADHTARRTNHAVAEYLRRRQAV